MRRFLQPFLCLILRTFFRRIEVVGLDRVPKRGPVLFVLNHPNALIDPLFFTCRSPRPISFLAKEPLFHMPFIGYFVRAFDSLPVYRRQDEGSDPRRNRETFERARALLARGRAIAVFPEGTSHSHPRLRPLKTGAARLALGTAAAIAAHREASAEATAAALREPLRIVPAGLVYAAKGKFRSSALLVFGDPVAVPSVGLELDGNPPARAIRTLTAEIRRALSEVTLQAEGEEALELLQRAHRLVSTNGAGPGGPDPAREFEVRRRFLAAYSTLQHRSPERLASLQARLARYEEELRRAGLDARFAQPSRLSGRSFAPYAAGTVLRLALLLPTGLPGILIHYPAYRWAGFVAMRVAESEDVLATVKVLSAMLFFPITWAILAGALGLAFGWPVGLAALAVLPVTGYAALQFAETTRELLARTRAFVLYLIRRPIVMRLSEEGRTIREEILRLAESS